MRIVRRPARAGVHPVAIEATEPEPELDRLRPAPAQAGILNLEILLAGSQSNRSAERDRLAVDGDAFDQDAWRLGVTASRIDGDDAFGGRKPEGAVVHLPAGEVGPHTFAAQHAVGRAIRERFHGRSTAVGDLVQLFQAGPPDTGVAVHPEVRVIVFENLKDVVVVEPLARRDGGELPVLEAAQAAAVRANPQRPGSILVERLDVIRRQAIAVDHDVICPSEIRVDAVSERADPDVAGAIFEERQHGIVCQAVLLRQVSGVAVAHANQPAVVDAEPERAGAILEERRSHDPTGSRRHPLAWTKRSRVQRARPDLVYTNGGHRRCGPGLIRPSGRPSFVVRTLKAPFTKRVNPRPVSTQTLPSASWKMLPTRSLARPSRWV